MYSVPLVMGTDAVEFSESVACYSAQFDISSEVSDKFVSGSREVVDSVLPVVGAGAVELAAAVVHYSVQVEVSSGVSKKVVSGERLVVASVILVMGADVVAVAASAAAAHASALTWVRSAM